MRTFLIKRSVGQHLLHNVHYVIDAVPLNAILELYAFQVTCVDTFKHYKRSIRRIACASMHKLAFMQSKDLLSFSYILSFE